MRRLNTFCSVWSAKNKNKPCRTVFQMGLKFKLNRYWTHYTVIGYTTILNVKGGKVIGLVAHVGKLAEFRLEWNSSHFNRHHFAREVCRTWRCYILTYREYLQRRRKNTAFKSSAIRVEKEKNFGKINLIWNSADTTGRTGSHGDESRGREQAKAVVS